VGDRDWVAPGGLRTSLRRTKDSIIYKRTGNLRAVQILLGHTKINCVPCRIRSRSAVALFVVDFHYYTALCEPTVEGYCVPVP
jgi:hypothetical protein